MPGRLIFNETVGISYETEGFMALLDSSGAFVSSSRDVEFVQVPGRNGDLTLDNERYANIDITFRVSVDSLQKFRSIVNLLNSEQLKRGGYCRLEYTEIGEYFRLAHFVSAVALETRQFNEGGVFELTFNCKPQLFITADDIVRDLSQGDTFTTYRYFKAKPLFYLYGNGTLTITSSHTSVIPTRTVTVTGHTGSSWLAVDSELQDCYLNTGANANSLVTFSNGFPEFGYGTFTITWTGFTRVRVAPRYWVVG